MKLSLILVIIFTILSTYTLWNKKATKEDYYLRVVGYIAGWLTIGLIIFNFIKFGWEYGIISFVLMFIFYHLAKPKNS